MSSLASAPRDRWLPDGTQNGAGSTPSHDKAIRRTGANVYARNTKGARDRMLSFKDYNEALKLDDIVDWEQKYLPPAG